jgi:hypothetical protein
MLSVEKAQERYDYGTRLCQRIATLIRDEAPVPVADLWPALVTLADMDREVVKACALYETGRVEKATLDAVATQYIQALRSEFRRLAAGEEAA